MRSVAVLCVIGVGAATARAQFTTDPLPPLPVSSETVRLEPVLAGLTSTPTDVVVIPDGSGRLLVAELNGTVTLLRPDGTTGVFLDTSAYVSYVFGQHGVMSVACHPDFATPGAVGENKVYAIVADDASGAHDFGFGSDHDDVLYEWSVDAFDPDRVDDSTRREILRIAQPADEHNATDLCFDDAGLLHISVGDGANTALRSPNAQDTSNVYGSVLRIDPLGIAGSPGANGNYSIPADNPFVGQAGVDEIFAYGLRSPYRLTRDPVTGDLWVGDVGQSSVEEISRVSLGDNLGWDIKEGAFLYDIGSRMVDPSPHTDPALVEPVFQYDHTDGRCMVGGFVYRGSRLPQFDGRMIAADYQGPIGGSQRQGFLVVGDPAVGDLAILPISNTGETPPRLFSTIGADADGEVYLAGTPLDASSGAVYRLGPIPCSGADLTTPNAPVGTPYYGLADGRVTGADLLYYVNAWVAQDADIADVTTQNAPVGDPNYGQPDGLVTGGDIQFYVNLWVAGCN